MKNDKNCNFQFFFKLLFTDKFHNIEEVILLFKNLYFFNIHLISLFFYILECFFQKLKRKIMSHELFIVHVEHINQK
ncbi:hypothetical protein PFDG_05193 [Plasmodium falciparum Dd2]|uniref:Uncharacterized protein n=1 Tax=Plasmodium falciparum (isolate Dd2) TaxID=57267 RepID=A0A0L7M9V8_PLAF4|nr:hypothetical protein PFDG_05193 [Plasmodium falciparum Dd2]